MTSVTSRFRDRLRLLLVEDSEDDADLLVRRLRQDGINVEFTRVDTAESMSAALQQHQWDVVISDYSMPTFSAPSALAVLHAAGLDLPFIIVSGTIGEETAVAAIKAGAHNFFTKANTARLGAAIERELHDAAERRRRREAEQALAETRERMHFVMDATGVGTTEWDIESGTVVWSDLMERLHGVSPGAFAGTFDAFLDLIHPDDGERIRSQVLHSLAAGGADSRIEYRVILPDGSIRWIATLGRRFPDNSGVKRSAGVAFDITDQKRLQEELFQSQKMDSVGKLAGGVAHDFNNILTAISGYCHFLADRPGLSPDVLLDIEEIHRAVERAAALTRQLLAFSRKQVMQPRLLSLNHVVTNVSAMLRRLVEESMRLEIHLATDCQSVYVDPGQIEQVIVNLVVNARDAMPKGGTITLETANVTLDAEHAKAGMTPGPYVMLAVSDTGVGIPPEIRSHLFEPFFTTKRKGEGTGLGLATVDGVVNQSGGHVLVYSEVGVGTTFKLYFPVVAGTPVPQSEELKPRDEGLKGTETVLVVEDDVRLRELDGRILKRYGYRVLSAGDVEEAKSICATYDGHIDAVVTDVVLPGGSGRSVQEYVAHHRPATKTIYMSGYTNNAIAHHGVLEAGTPFLQKPFTPDALVRKIREALSDGKSGAFRS